MNVFGQELSLPQIRDRLAGLSTIAEVRPVTLFDGPQRGVLAVDVRTSQGLEYTVVPDRGMDICNFRYRGIPLDWSFPTGITAPALYDGRGWNWVRSFHGGIVTTCGLDNVGEPCEDAGTQYGGHGRISNTPACNVSWGTRTRAQGTFLEVSGQCRLAALQEGHLVLTRTVSSPVDGAGLVLTDHVENRGCAPAVVLLNYHCNFGWPLLSGRSRLEIPAAFAQDRQGRRVDDYSAITDPQDAAEDLVLYPVVEGNEVEVRLTNPDLAGGLGVRLRYNRSQLPHLTLWKYLQKRTYVLAIEPGTCRVEGRAIERHSGRAIMLEPDQVVQTSLAIDAITDL